jgi:hypothetical protein
MTAIAVCLVGEDEDTKMIKLYKTCIFWMYFYFGNGKSLLGCCCTLETILNLEQGDHHGHFVT